MSANAPQQVGASTIASEASHKQATYLPPSELAIKYAKGIHNHQPATPHPSATATGSNPHLIKKVEHFYVRPRWLLVRVSRDAAGAGALTSRSRRRVELSDGERGRSRVTPSRSRGLWTISDDGSSDGTR